MIASWFKQRKRKRNLAYAGFGTMTLPAEPPPQSKRINVNSTGEAAFGCTQNLLISSMDSKNNGSYRLNAELGRHPPVNTRELSRDWPWSDLEALLLSGSRDCRV